jgi:hypothetical protein
MREVAGSRTDVGRMSRETRQAISLAKSKNWAFTRPATPRNIVSKIVANGSPVKPIFVNVPVAPEEVSQRDIYNYYGRILSVALSPLICLTAAFICTFVGIRLLRSSGAVATQVISPQDYPILGPVIAAGKDEV